MTILQIQYALELERVGSYSKAAKLLHISQPALSLQIKKLEDELGFMLFDRNQKPIRSTFQGQKFLLKARVLNTEFHNLQNVASQLNDSSDGVLTVGIIPTLSSYLTPLFIDDYRKKHPNRKLIIKEMITEEVLESIMDSSIDMGIVATPITAYMDFSIQPVFYERFLIYLSEGMPQMKKKSIPLNEIDKSQLWLLKEGNCFRDQVADICEMSLVIGTDKILTYESNNIEALCRIVDKQSGFTFIPELSSTHVSVDKEDQIKIIDEAEYPVREISFISLPNSIKTKEIQQLFSTIQSNIPRQMLNRKAKKIIHSGVQI